MLDDYDHRRIKKPKVRWSTYQFDYEECIPIVSMMKQLQTRSNVFGKECKDIFRLNISAVYQAFDNKEVYPTLEEKTS